MILQKKIYKFNHIFKRQYLSKDISDLVTTLCHLTRKCLYGDLRYKVNKENSKHLHCMRIATRSAVEIYFINASGSLWMIGNTAQRKE